MNKIIPRKKWVVVEPVSEASRELKSGLILPSNTEQERKAIGTVIAAGLEIKDIKKGDKVIFGAYAGEIVNFSNDPKKIDYKILHDDDIIAFLK